MADTVHATAITYGAAAALIRGPSGSGKSDLALRCILTPLAVSGHAPETARLVADDRVVLERRGATIEVSPPPTIAGRIEVRGLGIQCVPFAPRARLVLLVDLVAAGEVDRMPRAVVEEVLGLAVPRIALAPFETSATAKLALAVALHGARQPY